MIGRAYLSACRAAVVVVRRIGWMHTERVMARALFATLVGLLILTGCEGVLECDICGEDHATESHADDTISVAPTGKGETSTPVVEDEMDDSLLLGFVSERRNAGFERVNAAPYPSEVSSNKINVFVSSFAVAEYLETRPELDSSEGMLPRGAFVVREIVDESGEVSKLTAIYRGPRGYNPESGDFWFAVADPDGNPATREDGTKMVGALQSCSGCHAGRAQADYLFGVPDDFRDPAFFHPATQDPEPEPQPTQPDPIRIEGLELVNVESELSRPQVGRLPAFEALPGQVVVVARDADRSTFEAYWGPLPAEVVFINMGGTGSFGAPIINGGEHWQLRDAAGTVLSEPTPIGDAGNSYRLEGAEWTTGLPSDATPGSSNTAGDSTQITEWSDADDYHVEFVELRIGQR